MNTQRHVIEKGYANLSSSERGLSQAEAILRQVRYGGNKLKKIAGPSLSG